MIGPLRRRHRITITILFLIVIFLYAWAIIARKARPRVPQTPGVTHTLHGTERVIE